MTLRLHFVADDLGQMIDADAAFGRAMLRLHDRIARLPILALFQPETAVARLDGRALTEEFTDELSGVGANCGTHEGSKLGQLGWVNIDHNLMRGAGKF